MITEADRQMYKKYKGNHDGTMTPFIKWYENGGRRPRKTRSRNIDLDHIKASNIVKLLRKDYTATDIAEMLDIGQNLVYQLQADRFNCSVKTAREIIKTYESL